MKYTIPLLVVFGFFSDVSRAWAQVPTVTISKTDNSKAGQLNVTGSYTIPKGFTFNSISVFVFPTGGAAGQGGGIRASVDQNAQTYSGTPTGIPTGTYDTRVMLIASDTALRYFYSNTVTAIKIK
jgi:hypothetical protein